VVLSGGGNLGALQVGMLRALVEAGIPVESADFRPPWPAQLLRD
jgi:hypothetical protein